MGEERVPQSIHLCFERSQRAIFGSCILALTVVFGSSFPCLLLFCLAFRCPHVQPTEGSSQAPERIILKST